MSLGQDHGFWNDCIAAAQGPISKHVHENLGKQSNPRMSVVECISTSSLQCLLSSRLEPLQWKGVGEFGELDMPHCDDLEIFPAPVIK